MADVDDGNAALVAQALDVGHDLRLARLIERGQRFVHQQQPGAGEERPPDGDPLLFASRKVSGPAVEQMTDAEEIDDAVEVLPPLARAA